jgi:Ca2+-binding RTX toxin-like protein
MLKVAVDDSKSGTHTSGKHWEATGGVLARDTDGNFYVATGTVATDQQNSKFAGYVLVDNTADVNVVGGVVQNGISAAGHYTTANGYISWNNDNIFNAAKLTVEMEYQHMAVDQFSRAVSTNIQEFAGVSTARNAAISLEFGQAAYRFGHSSLRETLDVMDPNGGITGKIMSYALEQAFLQPGKFATVGAGAVIQGAVRQLMNEVDQFVTPAMNEGLLGQPLDLAAINIARGRDTGLPTLNEFKKATGVGQVYANWEAFHQNMTHPEAIADFIAAYSFDGDLAKAKTIVDLANLPTGGSLSADEQAIATANHWTQALAHDFMLNRDSRPLDSKGQPIGTAIENSNGIDKVDLWIGGLAETHIAGGILGETFDSIFVYQIENLMDGDRFYYLQRLINVDFGNEIQNEQFKDVIERTTGARNLNGNVFAYADQYYDEGQNAKVADLAIPSATQAATSTPLASADLYMGSKSITDPNAVGYWTKVFDANSHGWLNASTGAFDQTATDFNNATKLTKTVASNSGPLFDLYGQKVTDLFDATGRQVYVRSTMSWTDPSYKTGNHALYFDVHTDANGNASATSFSGAGLSNLVFLGADQHKYGSIAADYAADLTHHPLVAGTDNLGTDTAADSAPNKHGIGIYSEDFTTTALNGTIGAHKISLVFGDDSSLTTQLFSGSTEHNQTFAFTENFIYDARPDGATTNLDGSIDVGANSAEVLVGTKYNDYIQMGIGDDTVYGGDGNDIIYGGNSNAGHNSMYGGDGNDYLVGGDAAELSDGGNGDDWVFGMSSGSSVNGVDQLIGGVGNDHIFGGVGIDKLFGGTGDDYMYGGQDTDPFFYGGDGNDYLNGGTGQDILFGGNGADILDGGPGQDNLYGGNGDDILRPGDLADVAGNGGGADVLIGGDNTLNPDGSSTDTGFDFADYSQVTTTNGLVGDLANQATVGQLPKDTTGAVVPTGAPKATNTGDTWFELEGIIGTKNADVLYGDSAADGSPVSKGNNWLVGGSGNDLVVGRGGNDVIIGGSVRLDTLIGKYTSVQAAAAGMKDAYHSATDYTTNAEGASHRVYDDYKLGSGLLDAASTTAGVTFEKRFTDLLKSAAYKDYVLGDGGSDGPVNVAAYTGSKADYKITAIANSVALYGVQAYTIQDLRAGSPDGTDVLVGIQAVKFNFDEATGAGNLFLLGNHDGVGGDQLKATTSRNSSTVTLSIANLPITDADITSNGGVATPTSTVWQSSADGTTGWTTVSTTNGPTPANYAVGVSKTLIQNFHVLTTYVDAFGNETITSQVAQIGTQNADTMVGTTGADLLVGLNGNDTYTINNALDVVSELSGNNTGTDTVLVNAALAASWNGTNHVYSLATVANVENMTIVGELDGTAYTLVGNASGNLLTGGAGVDSIDGGTGGDQMLGLGGKNTYYVDNTGDRVYGTTTTTGNVDAGGIDNVITSVSFTLGAYVENLSVKPGVTANLTLTGNALSNAITGGAGNDTLIGGAGTNTLDGGAGTDTVDYSAAISGVTASILAGTGTYGSGATGAVDVLINIENITGSRFDDVLTGGIYSNVINGGAGNDSIMGGVSQDRLTGGTGRDTFIYNSWDDTGATTTTRDIITDFSRNQGDKISLTGGLAGLHFIGTGTAENNHAGFTVGWHLERGHVVIDIFDQGGATRTNGLHSQIELLNVTTLAATDFLGLV